MFQTAAEVDALDAALPNLEELVVPDCPEQLSDSPIAARIRTLTLTFRGFIDQRVLLPRLRSALRRFTALSRVRIVGAGPLLPTTIDMLAALDVPIEIVASIPTMSELGDGLAEGNAIDNLP